MNLHSEPKKLPYFLLVGLIALICGAILHQKPKALLAGSSLIRKEAQANALPRAIQTPIPTNAIPNGQKISLIDLAPSEELLTQEMEENPHETPPSVIHFAESLAPLMIEARQSESRAILAFEKLNECVAHAKERNNSSTIATICASNAHDLTRLFPQVLSEKYASLETRLTARERMIVQVLSE